jgi:hypothetical protein
MNRSSWRINSIVLLGAIACLSGPAMAMVSREDGDRLQVKLKALTQGVRPHAPSTTTITEAELNSYLTFNAQEKIPHGLSKPSIRMLENGQLSGRVLVDIMSTSGPTLRRVSPIRSRMHSVESQFTARGTLRTHAGKAQFRLASADIMGLPLPKAVFQQMVSFFTRTRESPSGFDIDTPFDLPAKIREIVVNRAEAVVIQ